MSLPQWDKLTCDCGSVRFTKVVHLKYHPTGGSSEEPAGYICADCDIGLVDLKYLLGRMELKRKREELRSKEQEIEETQAVVKRGPGRPPGGQNATRPAGEI